MRLPYANALSTQCSGSMYHLFGTAAFIKAHDARRTHSTQEERARLHSIKSALTFMLTRIYLIRWPPMCLAWIDHCAVMWM